MDSILSWLTYISGLTGLSWAQIYIGLKIFRMTKSFIKTGLFALAGLAFIYYFSDGTTLITNPKEWLDKLPLQHFWDQLVAIFNQHIPWLLQELKDFWNHGPLKIN